MQIKQSVELVMFFLVVGSLVFVSFFLVSPKRSSHTDKFIVANPVDLVKIGAISKFRSCVGHDYSGLNSNGEKESNRSMKHYFDPQIAPDDTSYKVNVFAPFDGKIDSVVVEQKRDNMHQKGGQVWLTSASADSWKLIFFHIELLPQFKAGIGIKSGEPIGYFVVDNRSNFDIALKKFAFGGMRQYFDSIFTHMDDAVLTEYRLKGISPETVIISKDYRDSHPCNFNAQEDSSEWILTAR